MTISVAMATYNGARFIGAQLDSLARQTRLPDELVVTDDASSDGTADLVERFAATAPFAVRLERNRTNLGFNGNFERALRLTTGDIVFISDQDDIWLPEKIERSLAALEEQPQALMVINDEEIMDAEGRRLGVTFLENVRKLGFPDSNHVAGCCSAMRRGMLDLILPFPEGINYDSWEATLSDLLGATFVLDVPLQLYRRHDTNSTETVLAEEGASMLGLARAYGLNDPREAWQKRLGELDRFAARIEERRARATALVGEERVARALARIGEEAIRLRRRLALLAKPRVRRLPSVLRLWAGGFYRDFAGVKSAVKDALRS